MIGTDDIVGIVGRVTYGGIEDRYLEKPYDELEDMDFWGRHEGEEEFWLDGDFDIDSLEPKKKRKDDAPVDPWAISGYQPVEEAMVSIRRWMATYDNGKIPEEALEPIGGGHMLRPDAAASWKRMERAARKDGVELRPIPGEGNTYRDIQTQHALAAEKGLYSKGGLAADPGTSPHGWGYAVDADEASRAWLAANGAKFGWETIPREPWHWEYHGDDGVKTNAFREPSHRHRPQPKSQKGATVSAIEGTNVAPEFSSLSALPGAVLGLLIDRGPAGKPQDSKVRDYSGGANLPSFVPKRERQMFLEAARATGVPAKLLALVAQHESGFRPNKTTHSSKGAIGRMQLMPGTAQELGVDPYNLRQNIMGGARYLARMLAQWKGDVRKALASYNAGPGNWQAGLGYADEIIDDLREAA